MPPLAWHPPELLLAWHPLQAQRRRPPVAWPMLPPVLRLIVVGQEFVDEGETVRPVAVPAGGST